MFDPNICTRIFEDKVGNTAVPTMSALFLNVCTSGGSSAEAWVHGVKLSGGYLGALRTYVYWTALSSFRIDFAENGARF